MYPFDRSHSSVLSQADVTSSIDRFVRKVQRSKGLPFAVNPRHDKPHLIRELGPNLQYLDQMIDQFSGYEQYDYSENLWLFINAYHDIRMERAGRRYVCLSPSGDRFLSEPETINRLVDQIRVISETREYRRKVYDRRFELKRQDKRSEAYTWGVTERFATTLVVRVNLYYHKHLSQRLRVEDVFEDMDVLAEARKRNRLFKHLIGYILRVEQGHKKGFHIHAAFFFNGAERCRQFSIAEHIGGLWEDITFGRGWCHDSGLEWKQTVESKKANGRQVNVADRGTGMFHRSDIMGRKSVCNLMGYLLKDKDQHPHIYPKGARAYRRGRCLRR